MTKSFSLLCATGVFLCGAAQALAQATPAAMPPGGPPRVLQIIREDVKPGKGAAHEKSELAYVQAFKKAKWPTNYLAMTSVTGPSEAWFLVPYESFEAWQKDREATDKNAALVADLAQADDKDGALLNGIRSVAAIYREDLSYRPKVNIAQMRYFRVITFRVRPGHDADFAEAAKIVRAAYEQANVELPWAVYQVSSGMPGPTFFVFLPTKSLQEIDAALARSGKIQEAEGEQNVKKLEQLASQGYLTTEGNIYALSPKMSYVSKEFAAGDPDFWTPKAKAAAKPAAGGAPEEKKESKPPTAPAKKAPPKK